MTRKMIVLVMAVFFTVIWAGISFAGDLDGGNERKGKYTYRKVFNACQQRGEIESSNPVLSPSDKTMAQWERMFTKKKFEDFKCAEEWSKLSETDLLDIYAYLHKHAADSPTPAKCK